MEDVVREVVRGEASEPATRTLWDSGDENQRALNFAYFGLGLLIWYVLGAFFQFLLNGFFSTVMFDSAIAIQFERLPVQPGFLVGAVAAVGVGMFARRQPKVNNFGLEVVGELRKVTWPPMDMTWKSTFAVIVMVFICSMIFFLFDSVWRAVIGGILR